MEEPFMLLTLAGILLGARLSGRLSTWVGLPPVFGELMFGLMLGPAGLRWLRPNAELKAVALLGVLLLMFLAGLETDARALRKVGGGAIGAALGGVLVPFFGAVLLGALVGLSWPQMLFLGAALTATSVSLSVQTLREMGHHQTRAGITILGAAILDDVLGMGVLALATGLSGIGQPLVSVLKMGLFLGVVFLIGRRFIPMAAHWIARHHPDERGLALVLAMTLGMSGAAEAWGGVAAITGAYLTGLFLAGTSLEEQALRGARMLGDGLLIPVFFVAVGLEAPIPALEALSSFGLALLTLAVISKWLGSGLGARLGGLSAREAFQVGAGMVSRGEVALVIATLGWDAGWISPQLYISLILVIMGTTLLAPLLLRLAFVETQLPLRRRSVEVGKAGE